MPEDASGHLSGVDAGAVLRVMIHGYMEPFSSCGYLVVL